MLTDRYKKAVHFAIDLHDGHMRKGTQIAYLSHLLSVSALVMENGGCEDEAIAALLHDALEDQGDDYESASPNVHPRTGREALKSDIEGLYGRRVRDIVVACTDDEEFERPPPDEKGDVAAWRVRKAHHIATLDSETDPGALRVACADKLHNARSMLLDHSEHGEVFWQRFRSGSRDNVVWYFSGMAEVFRRHADRVADSGLQRLVAELEAVTERIRAL
ncbi:MAG: HD domain-containing protein [Myxococcota bacterium]|nr:HD domain-containing protein [Myxococcota bacterium]